MEYAPSISANGKMMVFQSNRDSVYKLYETHLGGDGNWSKPTLLKGEINKLIENNDLIGGPSLSYDGNFLYYFSSASDGHGLEDIYYSVREGDEWGEPKNLGPKINSEGYEGFPSISSDGKSLYFMRLSKDLSKGRNCYVLMVSRKDDMGNWETPSPLPENINSGCEKSPRIMPDNKTFIFSSVRKGSLNRSFDLYQTKYLGKGKWQDPVPLDYVNTPGHDFFASVSSKADHMYLNFKGDNDYDIVSFKIPQRLKPKQVVNVEGFVLDNNNMPVSANLKLYDRKGKQIVNLPNNASDGSYTMVLLEGKYDLKITKAGYLPYKERISVEHPEEFHVLKKNFILKKYKGKAIVNITNALTGDPVEAMINVVVKTDSSTSESIGNEFDVNLGSSYSIKASMEGFNNKSLDFEIENTEVTEHVLEIQLEPKKPKVKFMPRDAETNEAITINFMVKNLRTKKSKYRGKLDRDTTLTLNFRSKYQIYGLSKDYLFDKEVLDLSQVSAYELIEFPVKLQKAKPGAKLTLDEIFFETNSSELDDSSLDELSEVYRFLKYNKRIVVEIAAHTDNVGSHDDNLSLSESRAQTVVDFLISKGVDASRIQGKGYGETDPIASNNSPSGRSKNRRVEFKVLKVN